MLKLNQYSVFFDILYLLIGLLTLIFSQGYLMEKGTEFRGEYPALILFSVIGMMLMTRANDLVILFLGLELLSLSLYVLVGFLRGNLLSNESGLKYLLLGAFATGFFLFGAALTYGATGTTNYNEIALVVSSGSVLSNVYLSLGIGLLIIGFAFKVALVPFHMWSPDVYQGAPTPITGFLCTAPKAAGFGALINLFITAFPEVYPLWKNLFWILAALSMTVGNISALVQTNVKRMLAFSSISHAGYILIGALVLNSNGISAVLFYFAVYSAMNLGAFSIITIVEKDEKGMEFRDYRGLAAKYPWLALSMAIFMVSLAGFPPTAGFIGKYGLLSAAAANGYIWLVIIAVLNTLLSAYYYLRLIVNMYMKKEDDTEELRYTIMNQYFVGLLAVIILILGIAPNFLLEIAEKATTIVF
jgi:NADH-quinone oxidoreductase subunit N